MVSAKTVENGEPLRSFDSAQSESFAPRGLTSSQWNAKVNQLRESVENEMKVVDQKVWNGMSSADAGFEDKDVLRNELTGSLNRYKPYQTGNFSREGKVDYHEKAQLASCFSRACLAAGIEVPSLVNSVSQLHNWDLTAFNRLAGAHRFKVAFTAYTEDDPRNHIELVDSTTPNCKVHIMPLSDVNHNNRIFVCTTMQHFFNMSNGWQHYKFFADDAAQVDANDSAASGLVAPGTSFGGARAQRGRFDYTRADADHPPAPPSVVQESIGGGASNVSGGVKRSKKRVIASQSTALGGPVVKNYRVSNAVMFNNVEELFQDKISREYAQEIIEELFDTWGVPLDQPEAAKYAEDLLFTFMIATTASNKADYNRAFDIPVKPIERDGQTVSSVEGDFGVFAKLLESKFGVTRRQFARGVADDLRSFLRQEENQQLLPPLATRVGCEPLLAYLAFDGSTHCSNMTTREITFTKTLESRNLFERDDVVAQGASEKLMQGMSGGVRSVTSR